MPQRNLVVINPFRRHPSHPSFPAVISCRSSCRSSVSLAVPPLLAPTAYCTTLPVAHRATVGSHKILQLPGFNTQNSPATCVSFLSFPLSPSLPTHSSSQPICHHGSVTSCVSDSCLYPYLPCQRYPTFPPPLCQKSEEGQQRNAGSSHPALEF